MEKRWAGQGEVGGMVPYFSHSQLLTRQPTQSHLRRRRSYNDIGDGGATALADSLKGLAALTYLDLS